MYLSKICLNPMKRDTAKALRNREYLHAAIEESVPGIRPHILWRLEKDYSILAISEQIPEFSRIQKQFGFESKAPQTREYNSYIDSFSEGEYAHFIITVNPVINVSDGSKNGKDVPLNLRRTEKFPFSAEDWMIRKFFENGVEIQSICDVNHETVYFSKGGRSIPIFSVTYEGVLSVVDKKKFMTALGKGIGGKKTYGFGLLTATHINWE